MAKLAFSMIAFYGKEQAVEINVNSPRLRCLVQTVVQLPGSMSSTRTRRRRKRPGTSVGNPPMLVMAPRHCRPDLDCLASHLDHE